MPRKRFVSPCVAADFNVGNRVSLNVSLLGEVTNRPSQESASRYGAMPATEAQEVLGRVASLMAEDASALLIAVRRLTAVFEEEVRE
jgi:hypothetical protein